jgi:hypothetical protein
MKVSELHKYTRQAMKLPQCFNYDLLCRRIRLTRPQAHDLMHYWRRRRWVSNVGVGQIQKTMIFGRTGNDRFSHLQPQIFPRARWSRRDLINARLDELIAQHNMRQNKDRRPSLADKIERILEKIGQFEHTKSHNVLKN